MLINRRDAGLVRSVGSWGLAASVVNGIVGAGIFVVPAALAAQSGAFAPLVLLTCGIAVGAVAVCFAEGGSRVPSSGGAYAYIETAYGPVAGQVVGTMLWLGNLLANGGIAAALADTAASVAPPQFAVPVRVLTVVGAVGGIALLNVYSLKNGVRLLSAAVIVKLVPLAVFVAVGIGAVHLANFTPPAAPAVAGFGRAMILALFAFTGMEGALCASGEVIDPARNIPRALALALSAVTLLYLAIQIIAQGLLGASLATSRAPLADAIARVSPALRGGMIAGTALSLFGWLCADILSTPRLVFAGARDGMLPRILGRVHPRSNTPYVAILVYSAGAIVLALSGSFTELAVLTALASASVYVAGCAAAVRLARRGVALAGPPLRFRGLGFAAVIGIVSMTVMVALASRAEILGLAVAIGGSTLAYALKRGRQRSRMQP
ncbi:MAG TPA: amino acid permease [Steroidobacteraceae bacterium]|nr:amino acid permease [Steroidobacteraceae bacterium]